MFLIRMMFWLAIVILILPTDGTDTRPVSGTAGSAITMQSAVGAASATMSDMAGFCDRNQTACETGAAAWSFFLVKAENAMRLAYRVASGQDSLSNRGSTDDGDQLRDASGNPTNPLLGPSGDTLRPDDRAPAWRGPDTEDA